MGISILFWILAIAISWIEPFLNRVLPDVTTLNEWLFGYYFIWMLINIEIGIKNINGRFLIK